MEQPAQQRSEREPESGLGKRCSNDVGSVLEDDALGKLITHSNSLNMMLWQLLAEVKSRARLIVSCERAIVGATAQISYYGTSLRLHNNSSRANYALCSWNFLSW